MFKVAIFDLDGTLLNTIDDLANACNYALSKFSFPTHVLRSIKLLLEMDCTSLWKELFHLNIGIVKQLIWY